MWAHTYNSTHTFSTTDRRSAQFLRAMAMMLISYRSELRGEERCEECWKVGMNNRTLVSRRTRRNPPRDKLSRMTVMMSIRLFILLCSFSRVRLLMSDSRFSPISTRRVHPFADHGNQDLLSLIFDLLEIDDPHLEREWERTF